MVNVPWAERNLACFKIPPRNAGDFETRKVECWIGLGGFLFCFDTGAEFPEEADELPCDGDLDLVVVHLAFA